MLSGADQAELRMHHLEPGFIHTDFSHDHCACRVLTASEVTITTPRESMSFPDGGVCHVCGGMMVRTGTCTTCTSCGETGGCG